jgi:hypothetical protein
LTPELSASPIAGRKCQNAGLADVLFEMRRSGRLGFSHASLSLALECIANNRNRLISTDMSGLAKSFIMISMLARGSVFEAHALPALRGGTPLRRLLDLYKR